MQNKLPMMIPCTDVIAHHKTDCQTGKINKKDKLKPNYDVYKRYTLDAKMWKT